MKTKTAATLIIGDEILSGRTLDTNTQTMARMLGEAGIQLFESRVIADDIDLIVAHLNHLRGVADYVFTTGGIGPTHDDKTAEAVAKAFGVPLVRHAEAWARLAAYYEGEGNMNAGRAKMADMPQGASLLDNPVSTAPGFQIGNVYVMAGVPKIMQGMFELLLPKLEGGVRILSRAVAADIPESRIAVGLAEVEGKYDGVSLGSYPRFSIGMRPRTSVVARGADIAMLEAALKDVAALMVEAGGAPEFLLEG